MPSVVVKRHRLSIDVEDDAVWATLSKIPHGMRKKIFDCICLDLAELIEKIGMEEVIAVVVRRWMRLDEYSAMFRKGRR